MRSYQCRASGIVHSVWRLLNGTGGRQMNAGPRPIAEYAMSTPSVDFVYWITGSLIVVAVRARTPRRMLDDRHYSWTGGKSASPSEAGLAGRAARRRSSRPRCRIAVGPILTGQHRVTIFNRMIEQVSTVLADEDGLNAAFHALADRTRRSLLRRLAENGATVTELARPYDISLAAVSKHIQVLERAGLAQRTVDGRVHHLALRPDGLRSAAEWVAYYQRFWDESLSRLDEVLREGDAP